MVVKRRMLGFSKEMLSKICQNLCSCFGYRLSYNHLNEVIPIGKEPRENCNSKVPEYGLKGEFG